MHHNVCSFRRSIRFSVAVWRGFQTLAVVLDDSPRQSDQLEFMRGTLGDAMVDDAIAKLQAKLPTTTARVACGIMIR
jgi:hypothetical protein